MALSSHTIYKMALQIHMFMCFCSCFRLHVNDKRYHVQPPPRSQTSLEEMGQLNDVRLLVAQVNKMKIKKNKTTHRNTFIKTWPNAMFIHY